MQKQEHVDNFTYAEILGQPHAWKQAVGIARGMASDLRSLWKTGDYSQILFTGCGSTYYLSYAASALMQSLSGISARPAPAGELVMYPQMFYPKNGKTLLVTVSRSADTTETVTAARAFSGEKKGGVWVISNYDNRPLNQFGEVNFVISEGQEQSIAQTGSFASMFVACTALAAILAGRDDLLEQMQRLPERGEYLLEAYKPLAQQWGENQQIDRVYFLGSGPRYGMACEGNLKMKEMSLTHSEAFHFLEFRHGPISMVNEKALVIGLLSDTNRKEEAAVIAQVKSLGGNTLTIGERDADVQFDSGLPEAIRDVLYLPAMQWMSYHRSLAKGLNPDRPNNLSAVVKLDW